MLHGKKVIQLKVCMVYTKYLQDALCNLSDDTDRKANVTIAEKETLTLLLLLELFEYVCMYVCRPTTIDTAYLLVGSLLIYNDL